MENENLLNDDDELITYDYSIGMNLKNFIEFQLVQAKEQFKKIRILCIVLLVILVLITLLLELYIITATVVVVIPYLILLLKKESIKVWKKIFVQTYKEKNLVSKYKFSDDSLSSIDYNNGTETKTNIPYVNIERAYETSTIIVIHLNKMMAHIIPKDQVPNLNELIEFLRENIPCFCKEDDIKFKIK